MYKEYIENIIKNRGQWNIPDNTYFEGHHIIPECLGGNGNPRKKDENIIWLYPEEHYTAHKLLALENPENDSLVSAWSMMAFPKGSTQRNFKISEDDYNQIKTTIAKLRSKKIICIETGVIYNSISEAIRIFNNYNIHQVISGKRKKAAGYHWATLDDIATQEKLKNFKNCDPTFKEKKVICIETQQIFSTVTQASKEVNVGRTTISGCLGKRNKTAGGFHWAYLEDFETQKELSNYTGKEKSTQKDRAIEKGKKVMCVETGEIFYGLKEAARQINKRNGTKINSGNIAACCTGKRKTTCGLHWKFINEEQTWLQKENN